MFTGSRKRPIAAKPMPVATTRGLQGLPPSLTDLALIDLEIAPDAFEGCILPELKKILFYKYICIYIYVYICIYTYICMCVWLCVFVYTHIFISIYLYIYLSLSLYIYIYIYRYIYIYIHICMYK